MTSQTIWGRTSNEVLATINKTKSADIPTLVILSGGMDSATCLAIAKLVSNKVEAVTFHYGQQHSKEIKCAENLSDFYNIKLHKIDLGDLAQKFNTALARNSNIPIPDKATEGVPATYVPFRNTIMLSIACGLAEGNGFERVFYGANIIDYSGYPDCRPEFIDSYNQLIDNATKESLRVEAPILYLTKKNVVQLGSTLGVPWESTWSCYRGGEKACGSCPSCEYRLKGFKEAGQVDAIEYED